MDRWIYEKKNVLTAELCENIITRFENDKLRQEPGLIGSNQSSRVNKDIKNTTDLRISDSKEWSDIDSIVYKLLNMHFKKYKDEVEYDIENDDDIENNDDRRIIPKLSFIPNYVKDTGYHVQKYNKNEGKYVWHSDMIFSDKAETRVITFIIYLNDICEGGETDFYFKKIKPEKGKIILFPAVWIFPHRGLMPISNDKYIITGWIHGSDLPDVKK